VSAARCGRVSYLNHDGSDPDVEKDLELFAKLRDSDPMHPSPLEHIAAPCSHMDRILQFNELNKDGADADLALTCKLWGNLPGLHQYRKFFPREMMRTFTPNHPLLVNKSENHEVATDGEVAG
jgi:hypothetical protein